MRYHLASALGEALANARASGSRLSTVPAEWQPSDLQDAWRIQHATWGSQPIAAWKVSALSAAQR
ncbi:MAG: hypothetical protein EOO24_33380, partial [Comamonadaceae bacterium]